MRKAKLYCRVLSLSGSFYHQSVSASYKTHHQTCTI